jgi:hypothetical protein
MTGYKSFLRQRFYVPEGKSCLYTALLLDEQRIPVSNIALESLTLTLYCMSDILLPILNAVDHMDILNTNGGTLDGQGKLTIALVPEDNVLLNRRLSVERHRMLIEWQFLLGNRAMAHEVDFGVRRLARV